MHCNRPNDKTQAYKKNRRLQSRILQRSIMHKDEMSSFKKTLRKSEVAGARMSDMFKVVKKQSKYSSQIFGPMIQGLRNNYSLFIPFKE